MARKTVTEDLEARGLLAYPIVGVAFDDWTLDQLVERARDSIVATGEPLDENVFARLSKRFSYVHGDFTDAATYKSVAKALEDAKMPVVYLEVPPSLFGTVVSGRRGQGTFVLPIVGGTGRYATAAGQLRVTASEGASPVRVDLR